MPQLSVSMPQQRLVAPGVAYFTIEDPVVGFNEIPDQP
jgi:hypothetical protein